MTAIERAARAVEALKIAYPDAVCSLDYDQPYRLLIATRLAAQCTDARVNLVTPELFSRFPTMEALAEAPVEAIEEVVKPCGFYHTKAADIKNMCRMLLDDFDGVVPDRMEDLLKLPGIGRKTANLILGDIYGQPSYVCDTHCIRITNLLGLTSSKDPAKVEQQLRKILEPSEAGDFCHRLVLHGRAVCVARRPNCAACCMQSICKTGTAL